MIGAWMQPDANHQSSVFNYLMFALRCMDVSVSR